MRISGEMPSIDHNTNKPAQKHQESDRQREKRIIEEKGVTRREALGLLGKGAMAGFLFASGLHAYKETKKEEDKKDEESLSYEDRELDIFNKKFNSVKEDLDYIKQKMALGNMDKKYAAKLNDSVLDWDTRFSLLEMEIEKPGQENYVIEALEKLGDEVRVEVLNLESGFRLGA